MIKEILEANRDVQVVSLLTCRRATATTLWSNTGWTCRRSITTIEVSKSKRAADAQVNYKRAWRRTEVSRNDRLTREGRQIEFSKARTPDVVCRAVSICSGKTVSLIELPIEI